MTTFTVFCMIDDPTKLNKENVSTGEKLHTKLISLFFLIALRRSIITQTLLLLYEMLETMIQKNFISTVPVCCSTHDLNAIYKANINI